MSISDILQDCTIDDLALCVVEMDRFVNMQQQTLTALMRELGDLKSSSNHNFHTLSHVLYEHGIDIGGCHGQHNDKEKDKLN